MTISYSAYTQTHNPAQNSADNPNAGKPARKHQMRFFPKSSNKLPPIPTQFLVWNGVGRPPLAISEPKTVQKIRQARWMDPDLTDMELAGRHGVSIPSIRKYTADMGTIRRHYVYDRVNRRTRHTTR